MGVSTYQIKGKNIYLDANIFIYLLEGYSEFSSVLKQIFNKIDQGFFVGVTSELTLAETLVKPMMDKNTALQTLYEQTIKTTEFLNVFPVSRDILMTAAKFRVESIRLPDAIHLATADLHECQVFLTNDKRLKSISAVEVIVLSDLKESTIC